MIPQSNDPAVILRNGMEWGLLLCSDGIHGEERLPQEDGKGLSPGTKQLDPSLAQRRVEVLYLLPVAFTALPSSYFLAQLQTARSSTFRLDFTFHFKFFSIVSSFDTSHPANPSHRALYFLFA